MKTLIPLPPPKKQPDPEPPPERPRTRAECPEPSADGWRRCPWISCRYHLWRDVDAARIERGEPRIAPEDMRAPCALDHADKGPTPRTALCKIFGLSTEQIRGVERKAYKKIRDDLDP